MLSGAVNIQSVGHTFVYKTCRISQIHAFGFILDHLAHLISTIPIWPASGRQNRSHHLQLCAVVFQTE